MGWRISVQIDLYTKGVLTVIAVLLAEIAVRVYISPDAVVQAQGSFAGLQFDADGPTFFAPRTGEIWRYDNGAGTVYKKYRLTKLGQPLINEK